MLVLQSEILLEGCIDSHRGVAQPGRALRSGRRGRWFKSSRPDFGKPCETVCFSGFTSFLAALGESPELSTIDSGLHQLSGFGANAGANWRAVALSVPVAFASVCVSVFESSSDNAGNESSAP